VRELRRAGYVVEFTSKQHLKVTHPTKRGVVIVPGTPSDNRNGKNMHASLRRTFKE
jgi:hypothetical protein